MNDAIACPFCGERRYLTLSRYGGEFAVECDGCETSGPAAKTEDAAIIIWNQRANTDAGVEERLLTLAGEISDVAEDFRSLATAKVKP